MRRLHRRLDRTVLVDNNPGSYALQPENGVPIVNFFGDPRDRELKSLGSWLVTISQLHQATDLRIYIDAYKNDWMQKFFGQGLADPFFKYDSRPVASGSRESWLY